MHKNESLDKCPSCESPKDIEIVIRRIGGHGGRKGVLISYRRVCGKCESVPV